MTMREPITEAINLKCSSCDSPLIVDDASREPAAIICCQGCGKEFGTVHEIADTAAILLRPLLRIDEFILTYLLKPVLLFQWMSTKETKSKRPSPE